MNDMRGFDATDPKAYQRCPNCGTESHKKILVEKTEAYLCEVCGTSWFFELKNVTTMEDGITTQIDMFVREPDKVAP